MRHKVTAVVKRCKKEDAKPNRPWCIYKDDASGNILKSQPKGWPKTYESKEKADRGLKMMKTYGRSTMGFKITAEEKELVLKRRKATAAPKDTGAVNFSKAVKVLPNGCYYVSSPKAIILKGLDEEFVAAISDNDMMELQEYPAELNKLKKAIAKFGKLWVVEEYEGYGIVLSEKPKRFGKASRMEEMGSPQILNIKTPGVYIFAMDH